MIKGARPRGRHQRCNEVGALVRKALRRAREIRVGNDVRVGPRLSILRDPDWLLAGHGVKAIEFVHARRIELAVVPGILKSQSALASGHVES